MTMIGEVFYYNSKIYFLGIKIDRTKFIISTLSEFKSLDNKQILMHLDVKYKDEKGIDAGNISKILLV